MSYVVLARKWRPQIFSDLTGQEHVTQTLTNALKQKRVPHALLFTGARGVGKTTMARLLAMALNCDQGPTSTPCGTCTSCKEIQVSSSVDVLEYDGASNRGINEIRELRESVRYAAHNGQYKVYIIDEVHMLTTEAFNALLKTLEEPPPHVIFIFATTEAQKIPVTILSRCQRFDFRRISSPKIIKHLRKITTSEGLSFDDATLSLIARQSEGCMRDALSLTDQIISFAGKDISAELVASILGVADRKTLFEFTNAFANRDIDQSLRLLNKVVEAGTDLRYFSSELVSHLRDLTVISVTRNPTSLTDMSEEELNLGLSQVKKLGRGVVMRMFDEMIQAAERLAHSNYPRLVFEMALIRMIRIEKVASIDHIIAQLEAIATGKKVPENLIQELTPLAAAPILATVPVLPESISKKDITPKLETGAKVAKAKIADLKSAEVEAAKAEVAEVAEVEAVEVEAVEVEAVEVEAVEVEAVEVEAAKAQIEDLESVKAKIIPKIADPEPIIRQKLTNKLWREIVTQKVKRQDSSFARQLTQAIMILREDKVILGLNSSLFEIVKPEDHNLLQQTLLSALGWPISVDFVQKDKLSKSDLASGFVIKKIEVKEAQKRKSAIKKRMQKHKSVITILKIWPKSAYQTTNIS